MVTFTYICILSKSLLAVLEVVETVCWREKDGTAPGGFIPKFKEKVETEDLEPTPFEATFTRRGDGGLQLRDHGGPDRNDVLYPSDDA